MNTQPVLIKMKKTLFLMSILGISISPLFGVYLWEKTPQSDDKYTLQPPPPLNTPFSSYADAEDYLKELRLSNPAAYQSTVTNMGKAWSIDFYQLEQITDATGLNPEPYTLLLSEDNSSGTTTYVLDRIMEGSTPYHGPPLVKHVEAQQVLGTKSVEIQAFVALGQDTGGGYGDKASRVEFWFKPNAQTIQWQRCFSFSQQFDPVTGMQYQTDGSIQSGSMKAIWDAGMDTPNFSTQTGKIRVLVYYEQDSNGMTRYESGWDGYEAENGRTFTLNAGGQMIQYNQTSQDFTMFINDNNIARIGSYDHQGSLFPVYQFTGQQLALLIGPYPAGVYAFGEVDNGGGIIEPKIIPVN